jgi:predicted dehydrogenase
MNHFQSHSRRAFLKSLTVGALAAPFVTRDMIARPPMNRLRHASIGSSGMAWHDIVEITKHKDVDLVAVADVDLTKTANVRKGQPQARIYQDWRELLRVERRNIDSVNVSTPDHMHAPIAMSAMQLGKNVYVQKPMAHDIHEVRALTSYAKSKRLVTQMGIQIHSNGHYRLGVLLLQAGAIGKIKEVHSWVPKSWGDPSSRPDRTDPIPEGLDWNGWLGVAADRPYIGQDYYHPNNWRNRLDFGTGTLGDMGCHILDPVFGALKLHAPTSIRSEGAAPNEWNWAINSRIVYSFPGTQHTAGDLMVTWYDGNQSPPEEVKKLLEGDPLPNAGSIFVGTQGTMVLPHINRPILYPDSKYTDLVMPEAAGESHYFRYVDACLGRASTTAGFDYSGPLTEAVLLGTVASRFPDTTLKWDSAKLSFAEEEANKLLKREYRAGWKVKGL